MKRLLLIVLPLLLIVGCSKEPINYETTLVEREGVFYTKDTNKPYSGQVFSLYDDGKKKGEGTLKDGKDDGVWTLWDNDGSKYEGKRTRKDDEDGTFFYWYDNKKTKIFSHKTYKDGKDDGLQTYWFENGVKKSEDIWKNGEIWEGKYITRYYNGQKEEEETWKNGKQDGLTTWWYENGRKSFEGTYKDGKRDGLFTVWWENGQKNVEEIYKDGNKISEHIWDKDGYKFN